MHGQRKRVEIRLLGEMRVLIDGEPIVDIPSDKVRALLAYLATNAPVAFRREALADLLWPDSPEKSARATLRNVLWHLRKVLKDDPANSLFETTYESMALRQHDDLWCDVAEFEAAKGVTEDADGFPAILEQAAGLYVGPFLAGFGLHACPEFETWVTIQREHYHRVLMAMLDRLANAYEARGDGQALVEALCRQLEYEPTREESHRRLMQVYVGMGRRTEALEQYRRCRRLLSTELGVTPDDATEVLFKAIRDQVGLPAPMRLKLLSLPSLITPLIGRSQDLDTLSGMLEARSIRLITIVGEGGIGKSHLALTLAHRVRHLFPDGVGFIELASVNHVERLPEHLAGLLGIELNAGGRPWLQLAAAFQDKRLLLILDNAETHVSALAGLVDCLSGTQHLVVLCTSRISLNLSREVVYRLSGLNVPPPISSRKMPIPANIYENEAIQLFAVSARRTSTTFALSTENVDSVGAVCRAVGGLPLGIILASGWTDMLSPSAIAERLADSGQSMFALMESDAADLPERHRSMWTVIGELWSLLSETEQSIFAGLTFFRGSFDYAAAQAVTGATLGQLHRLVAASCVQHVSVNNEDRYIVHELLRQYALAQLEQKPNLLETTRDRHARFYLELLDAYGQRIAECKQTDALQRFVADGENYRLAWDWSGRRGWIGSLSTALEPLCRIYQRQGRALDGMDTCRSLEGHLLSSSRSDAMHLRARAFAWWAIFSYNAQRYEDAARYRGMAGILLGELEGAGRTIPQELGLSMLRIAESSLQSNDYFTFDQAIRTGLDACRRADDAWGESQVYGVAVWGAIFRARYEEALQLVQTALTLRTTLNDIHGIGWALLDIAEIRRHQGRFEEAKRSFDRAVTHLRQCGDKRALTLAFGSMAVMYTWMGDPKLGAAYAAEARAMYREFGAVLRVSQLCETLPEPALHAGEFAEARAAIEGILPEDPHALVPDLVGIADLRLAKLALVAGDQDAALRLLDTCIPALRAIERAEELGDALVFRATCLLAADRLHDARAVLEEGLAIGLQIGHYSTLCAGLLTAALLAAAEGMLFMSVALYVAAQREPFVANSLYFAHVYGAAEGRARCELSAADCAAAAAFYANVPLHDVIAGWLSDDTA